MISEPQKHLTSFSRHGVFDTSVAIGLGQKNTGHRLSVPRPKLELGTCSNNFFSTSDIRNRHAYFDPALWPAWLGLGDGILEMACGTVCPCSSSLKPHEVALFLPVRWPERVNPFAELDWQFNIPEIQMRKTPVPLGPRCILLLRGMGRS